MATSGDNSGAGQGVGLPVGAKIGKYEVVERSGVGGQAIVYKCYDRSLDRFVAAKQISPHLAEDPKFVEHFRREAQILARLGAEGASIVTIHELLEEPVGLFIVMEFVQGHTLETVLRETAGPTEPKAALQIIWRLAAALHTVHAAGIIHRDLKPANIIVAEGLRPKITDFGVAASRTGQTSMLLGTTKYMAPELFGGGDVDGRADLYSLGMISYELLLGRPKFNEVFADVVRDPHSEAMRWMKWHSNDSDAAKPLHDLTPNVPEPLSDIVAKMMAKKPEDRFPSMEALGRAIRVAFSPKAKAFGGLSAAGARTQSRAAKAGAAAGAGMVADEGDELDLTPPPATAPVPRKPMSLTTKLVLAGVAFALVLSGAIFLVVRSAGETARMNAAARTLYMAGEEYYKAQQFEEAISEFQQVPQKYPKSPWSERAVVMVPVTKSRLATRDANTSDEWDNVAKEESVAQAEAKRVQAQSRDQNNRAWAGEVLTWIDTWQQERMTLRPYREQMVKAEQLFAAGQIDEALRVVEAISVSGLSSDQKAAREALRTKIALAIFEKNYKDEVTKGDEIAKLDAFETSVDFDAAKNSYTKAMNRLLQPPPGFPISEVQTRSKAINKKIDLLECKRRFSNGLKKYETGANLDEKLNGARQCRDALAQAGKPTDKWEENIKKLRLDKMYQDALAAQKEGRLSEAARIAANILRDDPNHAGAKKIQEEVKSVGDREKLISDGDGLYAQGKFAEALEKFAKAADIKPDPDLSNKIKNCQVQLKFQEADRLKAAQQWDAAIKVLEEIRALDSSQATKVDEKEKEIHTLQKYYESMAKGDEAFQAKRYSEAWTSYREAQKQMDTPEIRQKLAKVQYGQNLDAARASLEQKQWDIARAYAITARDKAKDAGEKPDEPDKIIAECDKNLPK